MQEDQELEGGMEEVLAEIPALPEPIEEVAAPTYLTQEQAKDLLAEQARQLEEVLKRQSQSGTAKAVNMSQAALNETVLIRQQMGQILAMQGQQVAQYVENLPPEEQARYWKAQAHAQQMPQPAPAPAPQLTEQQMISELKARHGAAIKEAHSIDLDDPGIDWGLDAGSEAEAVGRMHKSAAAIARNKVVVPPKVRIAPPPVETGTPSAGSGKLTTEKILRMTDKEILENKAKIIEQML